MAAILYTGIHPCYKCTITNKEMQLPPNQRKSPKSPGRSLDSMAEDYKKFVAAGAAIKNAQHFNNVIGSPILDIEPDVRTKLSFCNQNCNISAIAIILQKVYC